MARWYGSIANRLEENKMFCEKIEIGTPATEYHYSDRTPFEVVEVINQHHVKVRELDHKAIGDPMSNEWELRSNAHNPIKELKKRYGHWNWLHRITPEILKVNSFFEPKIIEKVKKNGEAIVYRKTNISFGHADYYYDYSF